MRALFCRVLPGARCGEKASSQIRWKNGGLYGGVSINFSGEQARAKVCVYYGMNSEKR